MQHAASESELGQVYPRVCGVDHVALDIPVVGDGLSPRVRGRCLPTPNAIKSARFIPACAG